MPRISMVLPALNASATLGETLESLCVQTYRDFELVFVDDGSKDDTRELVDRYRSRLPLRILRHETPRGVAASLNDGIAASDSELVARIDADDLALSDRLERQLAFLDTYPDIDICGTAMQVFSTDERGDKQDRYVLRHPATDGRIRTALLQRCALSHPSIMCRRSVFQRIGGYDAEMDFAEDYDLWCRAAVAGLRFGNLPEVLMRYRVHDGQVSQRKALLQHQRDLQIKTRYLQHFVGMEVGEALPRLLSLSTPYPDSATALQDLVNSIKPLLRLARAVPDTAEFENLLELCTSRHIARIPVPAPKTGVSGIATPLPPGPRLLCHFKGGIGNQLFQQAFALSLGRRTRLPVMMDLTFYDHDPYGNQPAVLRLFPELAQAEVRKLAGVGNYVLREQKIASVVDVAQFPGDTTTVVLDGYWQGEQFSDEQAVEEIRARITDHGQRHAPAELVGEIARVTNSVAVHLRRRDYGHMGLCRPAYYLASVRWLLAKHPDAEIFVFSDEPNFSRHLFGSSGHQCHYIHGQDDLVDLYLMSRCKHFVIANSSFSWWAARLGEHRNGTIFCPGEWTTVDSTPTPCPARWVSVPGAVSPLVLDPDDISALGRALPVANSMQS